MQDVLGYEGRPVVVTGAASGMGEATARILVDVGAVVTALDIKPSPVDGATSIIVDLKDQSAIEDYASSVTDPILGVFNCAGLPGPPFSDLDVMLVNFVGGRHLIEQLVPKMADDGAIAYVASNAGLGWQQNLETLMPLVTGEGYESAAAWCEANGAAYENNGYSFSKQAINAWVAWRGASIVAKGIRLNNTNPGPTTTAMMPFFEDANGKEIIDAFLGPIARRSTAAEQAWPLVFLNSPRMSYVNGEALHTDGGFLGAMMTGQIDVESLLPG